MRRLLILSVVAVLTAMPSLTAAQSGSASYPIKPIHLIIAMAPGGPNDILGRLTARALEKALGQPVVVENHGGANATLGTGLAAKAAPDGYTLLIGGLGALAISPNIYANLGYDTVRSFEHISMLAIIADVLVVHPGVPAKNLKELLAVAKRNPGKLNYAAVGGTSQLMAEMMNSMAALTTVQVPYKGASPALTALISGEVDYFFNPFLGLWPSVEVGKVRALAVTTEKRSPFAPQLPTMSEGGLPGYNASTWFSLASPAGTPRDIVTRLNNAVVKGLQSQAMVDTLTKMYAEPLVTTPEQTAEFMRDELSKWGKAVKAAGIKPQ